MKKLRGAIALLLVMCLCLTPLYASAEGMDGEDAQECLETAPPEDLTPPDSESLFVDAEDGGSFLPEPESGEEPLAEPESEEEPIAEESLEIVEEALARALPDEEEEETVEEDVEAAPITVSEAGEDNDALFRAYFENLLFPREKLRRPVGEANLTGVDKNVYSGLAGRVTDVAQNGGSTVFALSIDTLGTKLSWTKEELGGITILEDGNITPEARAAVSERLDLGDLSLELTALKQDLPFDMYWFDKTAGATRTAKYSLTASSKKISIKSGTVTYYFSVAGGYGADYYVYESEVSRAQDAAMNARAIVERYALCGDREKLSAYKNEICALTSYNRQAAGGGLPYGDPWQAIYVFDGDEETTVVCEGYAKAFEYLCDMSEFASSRLSCVSVTGTMGGGGHMWNIVTLEDGENVLADVTNCDAGTMGADDRLFLIGYYAGNVADGYSFLCKGTYVPYVYDQSTARLMTEEELTLAPASFEDTPTWSWTEDYSRAEMSICYLDRPTLIETFDAEVTTVTTPATCTETGLAVYTASVQFNGTLFTDAKSAVLPLIDHDPVFQSADWDENEEGVFGAYFAYECSMCGEETEEFVPADGYTDARGWRTYYATDRFGNTVSSEPMQQFYTVTYNGEAQPTQYVWGDICLLASADQEVKAWYLVTDGVETLVADGVSSYSFAVTDNTEIVTTETEHHEPQAAVAATLKSETAGAAVFNAMWSIPKGAQVQSSVIYRGYTTTDKDVSAETLVSKGTPYDTSLPVNNGSFRLNLSGLDATKYQHVMIRITYTMNGEEMYHDSAVQRVLPNGGAVLGS